MQNDNYLYIADNKIEFYQKKTEQFFEYILPKKVVEHGKIINYPKFLSEFLLFLKKYQILKKFQKNNLYIIIPPNFNEIDKEIWKIIFDNLSLHKMKFIKETSCYNLKKNVLWLNLNQEYAYLTYLTKHQKETKLLQDNYLGINFIEQLKMFLDMNKNIKKIFLFGNSSEINQYCKKIESQTNKIVLYFENPKYYLLSHIIRHNLI